MPHRALYIRLAKNEDRTLLEIAREFVLKQENAKTKGRLFMWKLSQLKKSVENTPNNSADIEKPKPQ
jgi:hypothetical protein